MIVSFVRFCVCLISICCLSICMYLICSLSICSLVCLISIGCLSYLFSINLCVCVLVCVPYLLAICCEIHFTHLHFMLQLLVCLVRYILCVIHLCLFVFYVCILCLLHIDLCTYVCYLSCYKDNRASKCAYIVSHVVSIKFKRTPNFSDFSNSVSL